MVKPAHIVAILHRDSEVVARVTRLATGAGLDIVRPASLAALARQGNAALISAIVTDLPAPRDGGIAMFERLLNPSFNAAIVVITDADRITAEAACRTAAAKGLEITIIHATSIDEAALVRQLCGGRDRTPQFGPADIDDCLENRHFRVEYQPKVSLLGPSTASQFGVEALCRMRDPRFGPISPDKFIPMAEKCGLIAKLTDAVVCEAFQAWRSWKELDLCLRLALNVSPVLLDNREWSERFLRRCAEFDMDPKWITLEITETAAGATNPQACEILTHLQGKGFALSIDDFGTGFSSLATLYRLPIAEMKIDKSFILDLQGTAGARDLVESAISMAKRMGIKVVAEGVESESVFHELRRIGCHEVQGFFVGKSMPADAVVPFFTGWRKTMLGAPSVAASKGLPKVAILQALVNEIINDRSLGICSHPAGPYGVQARVAETDDNAKNLIRKIPPLVLEGKTIPALALCHAVVRELERFPACNDMRAKVSHLQSHLEQELVTSADLEICSPQGIFRLIPRDTVTLGRPSPSSRVDIPVRCQWLSGGERNLRLFAKSGQWFVEDLGSTHGYLINDRRLKVGHPFELPLGETLVEVCLASGAIAPLSIFLKRTPLNPNAVTIGFNYDAARLRAELGDKNWSVLESELACTWIVFTGMISAGRLPDCALTLDDCTSPIAATIYFADGYWISPGAEASIAIDGTTLGKDVPLAAKSELTLGDCRLVIRETTRDAAASAPSTAAQFGTFKHKARQA